MYITSPTTKVDKPPPSFPQVSACAPTYSSV